LVLLLVSQIGSERSASAAAVTVDEDDVQFADSAGNSISWLRPDVVATIFIKDGGLETQGSATATWTGNGALVPAATTGVVSKWSLAATPAGDVAGSIDTNNDGAFDFNPADGVYEVDAAAYDTSIPGNTPLVGDPVVAGNFVIGSDLGAGTFTLLAGTAAGATQTATFNFHLRDSYDASATASKRAKVTSTSDPQGEFLRISEVASVTGITAVAGEDVASSLATTTAAGAFTVTASNLPIVDGDNDGQIIDDVSVSVDGTAATITSVDFNTGIITFGGVTPNLDTSTATATYSAATASASSDVYRGQIRLSSDAATQGSGDDQVWVQDGDTVTVTYLGSDAATSIDTGTVKIDGGTPIVGNISPADGTITNNTKPFVSFEVTDLSSGISPTAPLTAVEMFIPEDGPAVSGVTFQPIVDGFRFLFSAGDSWITLFPGGSGITDGTKVSWKIVATDLAGNTKTVSGTSLEITIDTTKPTVRSAKTGTSYSVDSAAETTGVNNSVRVEFTKNVTSVDASDFTVDGLEPSSVLVGGTGLENVVYLTVATPLAPNAKPNVVVKGDILDSAGNTVTTGVDTAKATATDGLSPAMSPISISSALAVKDDMVKVSVTVDERLATVGGMLMTIAGGVDVKVVPTSPTPLSREGSLTVGDAVAHPSGQYGVAITVTDLGGNVTNNTTKVTDEAVATASIEGTTITLANGPLADSGIFDGAVDGGDVTVTDATGAMTITAVNASARTVTVDVAPSGVVKATYWYVKDHTFQIDHTKPAVTFDPIGGTTIQNTSPFIRVLFTGESSEYPGDSYKTVTLSKADLAMPDGTTQDLLPLFESADSIEYMWAATGLALGAYTLTVSATDIAGNATTDASAEFTIAARAPFAVALRPGWNLISLPGQPADADINAVVTSATIDTVLTYDPTVPGGWITAVRDGGTFVGPLTTIDAGRAYWVHTGSFDPISTDIPGLTAGTKLLPPVFSLPAGWNLIPVSRLATDPTISDYLSGLNWSRMYGYNNTTKEFESILPRAEETVGAGEGTKTLSIGRGYFIFLTSAGTLVP